MGNQYRSYRIVALPGEGVGPEVVPPALEVLGELGRLEGFSVEVDEGLIGEPALRVGTSPLPDETLRLCDGADGILFGAVSRHGILELRRHFDFFANLRPIRACPALADRSSLRPEVIDAVDILFVRELVSGIYFGPSGRGSDAGGDYGFHTMRYHDSEIRRVARVALRQAESRRGRLTVAHKENALPLIPWTGLVREEAAAFPGVSVRPMLVDTLAMELVRRPSEFDVILAENLFGDILSDIGGALVGSIGLLPSASLNSDGFGLYEPVHGTAPDIAGRGIANPLGTIGAVGMMLDQWGEGRAAVRLRRAQASILERGLRTADLVRYPASDPFSTTVQITDALVEELSRVAPD